MIFWTPPGTTELKKIDEASKPSRWSVSETCHAGTTIPSRLIASPNFQNANLSIRYQMLTSYVEAKVYLWFFLALHSSQQNKTLRFLFSQSCHVPCLLLEQHSNTVSQFQRCVTQHRPGAILFRPAGSRETHLYPQIWFTKSRTNIHEIHDLLETQHMMGCLMVLGTSPALWHV